MVSEEKGELDQMPESMVQELAKGPSRGALMRIAREKAGLTVQQLANAMNLSQKQIVALEADDLDALPSATFVRGFVRNYARIVGCDPNQFAVDDEEHTPLSQASAFQLSPPAENMPIKSNRAHANRRWMMAAGVVILLGLMGGYLKWEHIEQARSMIVPQKNSSLPSGTTLSPEDQLLATAAKVESSVPEKPAESPVLSVPSSPAVSRVEPPVKTNPVPPAETTPAPTKAASNPTRSSPSAMAGTSAATASTAQSPAKAVVTGESENANAAPYSAPPRLDPSLPAFPVVLDVAQESWIDVREVGGKVFVHGIVKAGERKEYQARGQVKVVIGNAPGVSLSWKGRAIDLNESTKDSVAKLTLEPDSE